MAADKNDKQKRLEASVDAPRKSPATIHDVARLASVSSMTVSRVINRHKYVSAAMHERVTKAIDELGFSPNAAARNIHGFVRVGVVYSNPASSNLGSFLMGAFRESAEGACQILIESSATYDDPVEAVHKLIEAGVDAVLLPPPLCDTPAAVRIIEEAGKDWLAFATAEPRPDVPAVMVDDLEGARSLTHHLIALGHREIGFIRGDPMHSPARRREQGFRDAMAAGGLAVREEWIAEGAFTYRSGLDAARTLLTRKDRPSAIFASNDDMAAAAAAVAHGLGLDLPGDLSIGGFDDTPVATTVWPELTTIHQPIADMASAAVSMLVDRVRARRAGDDLAVDHRVMPVLLMERGSTARPRDHPRDTFETEI